MLYRLLLRLYPQEFRRRYGAELEADFADALEDAAAAGPGARIACYGRAALDLARSVPREWLRTPWLAAAGVALVIACAVFYGIVMRVHLVLALRSDRQPPESPAIFEVMGAMLLLPLAVMCAIGVGARVLSTLRPRRRRRV